MQAIAIFLVVAVAFTGYYYFGVIKKMEGTPKLQETVSQDNSTSTAPTTTTATTSKNTAKNTAALQLQKLKPGISVDTLIISGPQNGEIIDKTNKVTFEFQGILPSNLKGQTITFETKVNGLDKDWQKTFSNSRTIEFPPGSKEYTFSVRARTINSVDPFPAERTFRINMSPSFGKVKITDASHSLITIQYQLKGTETTDITNWKLKGKNGEFVIPRGVELFIPGSSIPEKDIFLKQSDAVHIYSKKDPFYTNKSFRPNKCFGYLNDYYKTSTGYSFSKICPRINRDEVCYFSKGCQSAVLALESCSPKDYSKNLVVTSDLTCQSYIDNYISRYLNYNGCIENYYKDKDFLKNYWDIYAGYDIVCKCNDTLYLYDQNGFLVDKYEIKVY